MMRLFALFGVTLIIWSCAFGIAPINFEEMGLAPLAKVGCPDLAGKYHDVLVESGEKDTRAFHWELLASFRTLEYANGGYRYVTKAGHVSEETIGKPQRGAKLSQDIAEITYSDSQLLVQVRDWNGAVWRRIAVRLDDASVGCRDGALVMRWRKLGGGGDFTPISQTYGEVMLSKEPDGSILMSTWMRSTQYSPLVHAPSPGMGGGAFTKTWRVRPVGSK